jgi:hypothetical protein
MKPHQLIQAIGTDLSKQIVTYVQTEHRAAYRLVLDTLAQQRKLRPVFLQKKSREEQAVWIAEQLTMRGNDGVAEQLVQLWLLKGQSDMLITFLDALGIKHDGKGEVEDLPDEIDEKKAKTGITELLKKYPPKQVGLYLHMFRAQKPDGWAGLAKAVESVPEIKLDAPA